MFSCTKYLSGLLTITCTTLSAYTKAKQCVNFQFFSFFLSFFSAYTSYLELAPRHYPTVRRTTRPDKNVTKTILRRIQRLMSLSEPDDPLLVDSEKR